MKFNFRKIASVLASAVMLGSTLGIAAAATTYPDPFIKGGNADVAVVIGANAAVTDFLAASDLGTNSLAVELAKQTATTGVTTGAGATGGDSINLATASQDLFMNSSLDAARTVLTKDHLANVLADGSVYDSSGTEYKYTQKITLEGGLRQVTFSKSGESIDPVLIVDVGTVPSTAPLYNYTVSITKALNVSNSNVIGTATFNLQGVSYTVGANSDGNTLYLYGSGEATTVNGGETKTVTVADKEHTIMLVGTTSTTTASVEVDGVRKSVTKGNSYKYGTGDAQIEVYIKDMFHAVREADTPSIDVLVGAKTLHFEDGQAVRYGADDTALLNTRGEVINSGGPGAVSTQLTSFSITQSAESSTGDYIKEGGKYVDRVLGGLAVQLAGANPTLDSETRDIVTIDTDNSVAAKITMTTYKAGVEKTISYARDADLLSDSALNIIRLANANNKTIHVVENKSAMIGDWILVNDNDEGRILEVVSLPAGTSSNDYVGLQDVLTGESFKLTTGLDNATTTAGTIGGGQYFAYVNVLTQDASNANLTITWGPNAAPSAWGTQRTIYPRIKLKNGEWMTFLYETTINNATTYSLPGIFLWSTYRDGAAITFPTNVTLRTSNRTETTVGGITYHISYIANESNPGSGGDNPGLPILSHLNGNITGINASSRSVNCIFNRTWGPAVLIEEEKTSRDSNGQAICIPLTTVGTTTVMPGIGTPVFTDYTGSFVTKTSDTYTSQAVDLFGTLVERNVATGTNYKVVVKVPDDQMLVDVLFTASGATVTPGTIGGGTVKEIGTVNVYDSEVSQVSGKNLIVIGGSCINTVAAKLLGSDTALCGAAFTTETGVGAGQFLVQVLKNPYLAEDTTKIAMLVAGYEAADTTSAVKYVRTNKPATDVGTKLKLSTTTLQTVA